MLGFIIPYMLVSPELVESTRTGTLLALVEGGGGGWGGGAKTIINKLIIVTERKAKQSL